MPFVKISLKKGKSKEFKKSISKSIHEALVSSFNIPFDDNFQVIEELEEDNIIYPDSYMDIKHTSNIIYIHISLKDGRTDEMKKTLYKTICYNINKSTNHEINDIIIMLIEGQNANWSFGNGIAQLIE